MIIETLDKIAEAYIPNEVHKLIHVRNREAWVQSVMYLIDHGVVEFDVKTIKTLATNWEAILYKKYSTLN
jgi:hypothetical protein